MLYRRKILLSLIDKFGGSLTNTDCQKLVFLYCVRSGNNYYDFFPYKYGAFSQVLYDDKRQLIRLNWLQNKKEYILNNARGAVSDLRSKDQSVLADFKQEIKGVRGEKLVRMVYLEFPRLASNSEIVSKLLTSAELKKVKRTWIRDTSLCLFTIGYEGKSIDYYLDQLVVHNIRVLIDVRRNPISRKFGFSKGKLSKYVGNLDIQYIHMPELGISSKLRKKLVGRNGHNHLFNHYRNHLLPQQEDATKMVRDILEKSKRIALTCFEADHAKCHRHIITDVLMSQPKFLSPIKHLT